jgi:hypothetical protein
MKKTKDALGRRSRWHWPKEIEQVRLTAFDLLIFEQLARYRYLRKDLLARLLPPRSEQTLTVRVGKLWAGRYLSRPEGQRYASNSDYSYLYYALTPKGRAELADQDAIRTVTQLHGSTNFAHDAAGVCNTIASIEAGAKAEGFTIITWEDVIARMEKPPADPFKFKTLIEGRPDKFRPDGFFGLLKDGRASFFCVEHERGNGGDVQNLNQASWRKKVLAYQHFMQSTGYKEQLGIPNMRVIVTTTSARKATNLAKLTEKLIGESNRFLFHHVPKLGSEIGPKQVYPNLFAEKWKRAGKDSARLIETST